MTIGRSLAWIQDRAVFICDSVFIVGVVVLTACGEVQSVRNEFIVVEIEARDRRHA